MITEKMFRLSYASAAFGPQGKGELSAMKAKNMSIMDKDHRDLLTPPHMVGEVIRLLTGEWQPEFVQQEQMLNHIMVCHNCRIALISLLSLEQKQLADPSEGGLDAILAQLTTIHHKIAGLEYEQMGAYAEAIVAQGQVEANQRFPLLVEHVKTCLTCKASLEELLLFLREIDEVQ